jgi:hypothetical protein
MGCENCIELQFVIHRLGGGGSDLKIETPLQPPSTSEKLDSFPPTPTKEIDPFPKSKT